jgi:hypothetical protein
MQRLTRTASDRASAVRGFYDVRLVFGRNGRETEDFPLPLLQHVAYEVILVQPLHNNDDAARILIIKAAVQRVLVPVIDGISLGFRHCFIGLQRVIDDHEVSTSACEYSAH